MLHETKQRPRKVCSAKIASDRSSLLRTACPAGTSSGHGVSGRAAAGAAPGTDWNPAELRVFPWSSLRTKTFTETRDTFLTHALATTLDSYMLSAAGMSAMVSCAGP